MARLLVGLVVLAVAGAAAAADANAQPRRPNVLFVFSDQQRAYSMGCYGETTARTPNLDAFARQGLRLEAAMSNTPVCVPFRASLMTGQYAHRHGSVSNGTEFRPKVKCLAEVFRDAGYATGYAGKWHLGDKAYPRSEREDMNSESPTYGFPPAGTTFGVYTYARKDPKPTTDLAIRFIHEYSRQPAPWLFMVSWIFPHSPYDKAPEGYRERIPPVKLPPNVPAGAAEEYARGELPGYHAMIACLDDEFGRILRALDEARVAEDTIVVFTSDHGDMLGSHGAKAKRWPHEMSVRVPFLLRYPRRIAGGRSLADPFGSPDIYPTLAGLAGVAVPPGLDGADFSGYFAGLAADPPREYVYLANTNAYMPWPGWRGIRTKTHVYVEALQQPWLLYDLSTDPWQNNNLVDSAPARPLARNMADQLHAAMAAVGDSWTVRATTGKEYLANWEAGAAKRGGYLEGHLDPRLRAIVRQHTGAEWPVKGKLPASPDE